MENEGFRNACMMIVLSVGYKDRLFGAEMCGVKAAKALKEECEVSLDKRTPNFLKETWPGIGALVLAMEDEFPEVRVAAVVSIGKIALAHPALKDVCVRVALEALQDRDVEVRLACIKVALEAKPKPLRASEIRLLLETIANDLSEEIKSLALEFFLTGPEFSDNALALASVEWLANITPNTCSFAYMFQFGKKHANTLYFCAREMEASCCYAGHNNKSALLAALAGVTLQWGLSLQLTRDEIKQDCLQAVDRFTKMKSDAKSSPFWQEVCEAKTHEQRTNVLKRWSGFDESTEKRLKLWQNTGNLDDIGKDKLGLVSSLVEDNAAPFQIRFDLVVNRPKTSSNAMVQIARYQVKVRGHHLAASNLNTVKLVCEKADKTRLEFPLQRKEQRWSVTVFEPISIPIATTTATAHGVQDPMFWVEF